MKTSWVLFVGLAVFYFVMAIIYWQVGGEPVGIEQAKSSDRKRKN